MKDKNTIFSKCIFFIFKKFIICEIKKMYLRAFSSCILLGCLVISCPHQAASYLPNRK